MTIVTTGGRWPRRCQRTRSRGVRTPTSAAASMTRWKAVVSTSASRIRLRRLAPRPRRADHAHAGDATGPGCAVGATVLAAGLRRQRPLRAVLRPLEPRGLSRCLGARRGAPAHRDAAGRAAGRARRRRAAAARRGCAARAAGPLAPRSPPASESTLGESDSGDVPATVKETGWVTATMTG
jgi:hypothetical protein